MPGIITITKTKINPRYKVLGKDLRKVIIGKEMSLFMWKMSLQRKRWWKESWAKFAIVMSALKKEFGYWAKLKVN